MVWSWTGPWAVWGWYALTMELMALAFTAYLAAMVPFALLLEDNQPAIAAVVVVCVLVIYWLVLGRIAPKSGTK